MSKKIIKTASFSRFFVYLAMCGLLFAAASCKDPDPEPPVPSGEYATACARGIYVLNEGLFQMNNSTLSYCDYITGEFTSDIFMDKNGRGLGDTGNDLQAYGAKLYCVVNGSENLEIMNLEDATLLKSISFSGKSPRKVAFAGDKAYVSCFDGTVVRVDTATMEKDGEVQVGPNPEGLCVVSNKLYVANTGGYNAPDYAHTLSVIDIPSFSVSGEIEVALNPTILQSSANGNLFVACMGNYADVPATLQKINTTENTVIHDYNLPVTDFIINGDKLYFYNSEYDENWNPLPTTIKVLDIFADQIVNENFITDGTKVQSPYMIAINPNNEDVYVADVHDYTVNGDVYCFDKSGKKKFSIEAGVNPTGMVLKK